MGIRVNTFSAPQLCELISSRIKQHKRALISNVNINALNLACNHSWFRDFLRNSDYVFCDGHGVMLAARIAGESIPEKITYAEWLPLLAKHCEKNNLSLFLLGGKDGVAQRAAQKLKESFPKLTITGHHHGYFDKDPSSDECKAVIELINDAKPDILIVSFGMPVQEKWLMDNWSKINANIALPAGAALDYTAGDLKRPPRWMTDHCMEWFGRMLIKPHLLWKRYLIEMPIFFVRLIKWRLALSLRKSKADPALTILYPLTLLSVITLYTFWGNTANPELYGRSIFTWMTHRWSSYGGYFTFCYFIPFISIGLIWRQRALILKTPKKVAPRALIVVMLSLLLQLISTRAVVPRLAIVSLISLIFSLNWFLFGNELAKIIAFPCAYLIFCIPLNFLERMTFPLRLFAAKTATLLLNGFHIETIRRGTTMITAKNGGFFLDVADACSGLKYFLVLIALGALFSHLSKSTILKKWLLFLLVAPIAVLANIIRILVIAIAAEFTSTDIAFKIYHDLSGYIVFIAALLLLFAVSYIINIKPNEILLKWKQDQLNRIS